MNFVDNPTIRFNVSEDRTVQISRSRLQKWCFFFLLKERSRIVFIYLFILIRGNRIEPIVLEGHKRTRLMKNKSSSTLLSDRKY